MPEKSSATAVIEENENTEVADRAEGNGVRRRNSRRPTVTRRAGAILAAVVVSVVIAVLGWNWHSAADGLDRRDADAANQRHAEQVALDYATGAAQMSFQNTQEWRGRLTKNTTPELTDRLSKAATSMEQLIGPLQWSSTAHPIAAKTESESNGVFHVICFVDVLTKNVQAPDGVQSTATYKLSIDRGKNWTITEISGIDSALGNAPR